MNRSRGIVSLEHPLAAHSLPSRLSSVFVLGVPQGFSLLIFGALFTVKHRGDCLCQ